MTQFFLSAELLRDVAFGLPVPIHQDLEQVVFERLHFLESFRLAGENLNFAKGA